MDKALYGHWNKDYTGDAARKEWESDLVPVVIGDACGTTQPLHDQTLAQINDCYAPVIFTSDAIDALA